MVNEPMPIIPKVNIIKDTTEGSSSLVKTLFKEQSSIVQLKELDSQQQQDASSPASQEYIKHKLQVIQKQVQSKVVVVEAPQVSTPTIELQLAEEESVITHEEAQIKIEDILSENSSSI